MASTLRHDSHSHELQRMGLSETNRTALSCCACSQPFKSGTVLYGCCHCSYFLHRTCAMLSPSLQKHRAHRQHPLRLYCAPTDVFLCSICGNSSGGFSYRCVSCDFVAHSFCVQLPQKVRNPAHDHHLLLSYRPPSKRSTHCNACRNRIHHACYSCHFKSCVFELHPGCTTEPLVEQSGRKKGYKRAKAKKFLRRCSGGFAKTAIKIGVVVGVSALLDGAAEFLGDDDADCDGDDVGDVPDIGDDGDDGFAVDMDTFYDLPPCDGTLDDGALQEEATLLLLAHMEGMGAGGIEPCSS